MNWPANWAEQMWAIHGAVNTLPYVGDAEKYKQADFWTEITESGGDCEDYSITKLRRLIQCGWPVETLHLACCYVETGEYHAVLVVETPDGAYMLDNRIDVPVTVDQLKSIGYRPHVIQAVGGKPQWKEWLL